MLIYKIYKIKELNVTIKNNKRNQNYNLVVIFLIISWKTLKHDHFYKPNTPNKTYLIEPNWPSGVANLHNSVGNSIIDHMIVGSH